MSFSIRQLMMDLTPKKAKKQKLHNNYGYSDSADNISDNIGQMDIAQRTEADTIQDIHRLILNLTNSQEDYKREIKEVITQEIASIKSDLERQFDNKVKELENRIQQKEDRINVLEVKLEHINVDAQVGDFPIDKTMVVLKLGYTPDENIDLTVTNLIKDMNVEGECNIVKVQRLPRYNNNTSPLVKVQFGTKDERDNVLKYARNLKNSRNFKGVFVRASLSASDRQLNNNFRSLVRALPSLREQVHVTVSGKLVPNRYGYGQGTGHASGNGYGNGHTNGYNNGQSNRYENGHSNDNTTGFSFGHGAATGNGFGFGYKNALIHGQQGQQGQQSQTSGTLFEEHHATQTSSVPPGIVQGPTKGSTLT